MLTGNSWGRCSRSVLLTGYCHVATSTSSSCITSFGLKCKVFNLVWTLSELCFTSSMSRPSHSSSLCLCGCRARTLEKQSDNMQPVCVSVCFHRGQTSARRHRASVRGTDIIHTPEWTGHVWLELCHTECAVCALDGTTDWDLLSLFSPPGL